jgi:gamma-glutamylputrescine oxidase
MSVSVWQELATDRARVSHDVVVVGAGMVGTYVAGLLCAAGRDVGIVERRFVASGASGCNAGFVLLGMRLRYPEAVERFGHAVAREVWGITADNVQRMREIARHHGVEHYEGGSSFLAVDLQEAEQLQHTARLMQEDGLAADYVDRDPLERGFWGAMLQPGDFAVQPAELTQALARASGATIYENDEVFELRDAGAGLVVRSRRHEIHCGQVVLAVNASAALVSPFFEQFMEPMRNQVLLTEPLPGLLTTMGYAAHGYHYFRQLDDGRLLVGGGRHRFFDQERTFGNEVTANVQSVLESFLATYFPEAAHAGISRRWAGNDGLTVDGLPLVGTLPEDPRVSFAVGFSGHGNSMGLVAAERLAELVVRGTDPGVFGLRRFE